MSNKVTPEQIQRILLNSTMETTKLGRKTTCVTAILPSGFEIVATSSCVDPANYDEALGRNLCIRKIEDKLRELEGYRLQVALHETPDMEGDEL